MVSESSFECGVCGEVHEGLPLDYAYGLPDEVFALSYLDRYRRSRSNADLCTLDESRFFIRCVLPVPFSDTDQKYVWGIWAEVTRDQHDQYVHGFYDDLSQAPAFSAKIANDLPRYPATNGLEVLVQFQSSDSRPALRFGAAASHPLAVEQRFGITRSRHHEILEANGFFGTDE